MILYICCYSLKQSGNFNTINNNTYNLARIMKDKSGDLSNREKYRKTNSAILGVSQNIQRTQKEKPEQSSKRLSEILQQQQSKYSQQNQSLSNTIKELQKQKQKLIAQNTNLQDKIKRMDQQNKEKVEELTQILNEAQKKIQIEKNKTQKAVQEVKFQKQNSQKLKQLYEQSQEKVNNYRNNIQNLKEKNRCKIIQFKNTITSIQNSKALKQIFTEKQIQTLLQKQKLYQSLISKTNNEEGKSLAEYIQLCHEKQSDIQKMLLSMMQKEQFYRNIADTLKKEQEEQKAQNEFIAAQCDKVEDNLQRVIKIYKDEIFEKVDKLILENQRLNKQIQMYKKIEQKVKNSQSTIRGYQVKMQSLIQQLKKHKSLTDQSLKYLNLYNESKQQISKLKQKIKKLEQELQQAKSKEYITSEKYKQLQNSMDVFYDSTKKQLDSLKNSQVNFVNLQTNLQRSTGNIQSTLVIDQRVNAPKQNNFKFQFFEQNEQASDSLISAIEQFQKKSIAAIDKRFESTPSQNDNFGTELIQGSLLLIFKLSGSYLGVFSSKYSTEHEKSGDLFMFSLNSRTDRSIGLQFKDKSASPSLNRIRFSEGNLVIGQNELVLKNNSKDKKFTLNYRAARQKYFSIDPKGMGIEDQLNNGSIQYQKMTLYRVYFH